MNKAFKVLWNQVRGSYVVASEAQVSHGKPGKAVKTIVAAAVAGLMAMGGAAQAEEILVDYGYVTGKDQETTKFISGNGNTLNIQTNADVGQIIEGIKEALKADSNSDKLNGILEAIGTNKDNKTAILTGTAGGVNVMDGMTASLFGMVGGLAESIPQLQQHPELIRISEVLSQQFNGIVLEEGQQSNSVSVTKSGGTKIIIGGSDSEPVLLATVGADRVVNAGIDLFINEANTNDYKNFSTSVVRQGDVNIDAYSGNLFGLVGGSSAINVNGPTGSISALGGILNIQAQMTAESTSAELAGNVKVALSGHSNAAGVFLSGSAIALGGTANSTVSGNTTLEISSAHHENHRLSGVTVGVFGGGLAASTLNGTSTTTTKGTTTIKISDGVSVGLFGSGAALSADLQGKVWDTLSGIAGDGIKIDLIGTPEEKIALLANGGTATVVSKDDINVTAGGSSVTVGVAGGGLAMTSAGGTDGTSKAFVETGKITLDIGDKTTPKFNEDAKVPLQETATNLINEIKSVASQLKTPSLESLDSIFKLVEPITVAVNESQTNYQGAHVGNVGGSLVIARMPTETEGTKNKAIAEAKSTDITVNLNAGYSVATLGGGMTVAMGAKVAEGTHATSEVDSTTVNIKGGDHVLVMAGGAAYATGDKGQQSKLESRSDVTKATMDITGGTTDGIFGGGLAIDDTGSSAVNASATTKTVTITVSGENTVINKVNTSPLSEIASGSDGGTPPTNGTYVADSAELIGLDHGKAAIVGGGIATGARATVYSENVNINLNGGKVNGNVYGGGAATIGGHSTVGTAVIAVNGSVVDGDIYGGGLVGSSRNNNYDTAAEYAQASTSVNDVTIELNAGSVKNVYVGGFTYEGCEGITPNNVKTATVRLGAADVFKGEVIDGSDAVDSSALEIVPTEYEFAENQKVIGFDTIAANGSVSNLNYEFAGTKDSTTVTGGAVDFARILYNYSDTLVIGDDQTAGVASIDIKNLVWNIPETSRAVPAMFTIDVNKGLMSLNADSETALASLPLASAEAALYVTGEVDLNEMAVTVGDVEAPAAGLYLGADGLLIADAAAKSEVIGTADTAKGKIHFTGVAEDGAQVTVAAADETATSVDNVLYKVVKNDNVYTFAQRQGKELRSVGLDDFDDPDFLADLHNHDNDGAHFVEEFLDERNTGVTNANRSQQLNAAVNLATAAGVQTAAIDSATIGMDAANKRASMIHEFEEGGVLFAEASGRRTEMGGSADFGEIKAELGGVVVGGEYTTGDWTFGALANVGTGSVKGLGHNDGVENDVDYYGAQAYAAKRFGQFNVVGQLGYLATSNEISHSTVALNKADVDADVIMAGVRGEVRFDLTENTRLVPYVGFNYLRVGTDGYTTSQGVKVDSVDQNLFTVPVGVKYAGDMQTASGWAWTPSVDIGYVAAFGDRDVDAKTHVGAVGSTTMDVWAESVVRSSIGLKAQKDNFGIGVEAGGVVGSQDTTGLFGQIRVDYRF